LKQAACIAVNDPADFGIAESNFVCRRRLRGATDGY